MLMACFRAKEALVPILQVGTEVTFLESQQRTLSEAEQGLYGGIPSSLVLLVRKSRLAKEEASSLPMYHL